MVFAIYHTSLFDKHLEKMPKDFKEWVEKIEDQLVLNPFVGDQIRVPWCREKKKDKYRINYLIYEELNAVYMVAISEKRDQQAVINTIFMLLDQYKEQIQNLLKT